MKQQSASRLSERQIAEFVENVEVEPREMIGESPLASSARFRFEAIDEIDGGEGAPSATSRISPASNGVSLNAKSSTSGPKATWRP
jgi:hypothetical protein